MLGFGDSGDLEEDAATIPTAMADSWRAAEAQLFGAVLAMPELYRSVIALVADTVDRLRQLGPSTEALLNAAPTIAALVRAGLDDDAPAGRIDPELAGRAALAVRHREVIAEQASARRVRLLAAARAAQRDWVVVEESGDWAGDPLLPYRRLEAHATTGKALLVTATPADDFRTSQHAVEVVRVDLGTGRVDEPATADPALFRCLASADREARVAALRAVLIESC